MRSRKLLSKIVDIIKYPLLFGPIWNRIKFIGGIPCLFDMSGEMTQRTRGGYTFFLEKILTFVFQTRPPTGKIALMLSRSALFSGRGNVTSVDGTTYEGGVALVPR